MQEATVVEGGLPPALGSRPPPEVVITDLNANNVFENMDRYNSLHHSAESLAGKEAPLTADEHALLLSQTAFNVWAPLVGRSFIEIKLGLADCRLLIEAGKSGQLTKRVPNQYREELEELASRLVLPSPPYFVRLNKCSLKDGSKGAGPFHTGWDVVEGLVTSWRCWEQIRAAIVRTESVSLYLTPWRTDINVANEFRAFIYRGSVTAVSQYSWATDFQWVRYQDILQHAVSEIQALVDNLIDADRNAASSGTWIGLPNSFTMDVLIPQEEGSGGGGVELIELNSFGAQLAAGSCLFHWIHDYDVLYGSHLPSVEVRVVSSEGEK